MHHRLVQRFASQRKLLALFYSSNNTANGGLFNRASTFAVLDGYVDKNSPEYTSKEAQSEEAESILKKYLNMALSGGGEKAIERHTKRNKKLLVRDRLSTLLDKGTDFLEFSQLAGLDLEYGHVPCAGVVTGIGQISDQLCVVIANDATVKGGTVYPITLTKQLRAQDIAEANRLPCIYLIDSGGAFLPLQTEVFPETGGRTFYNEAVLSMKGIPQVCIVCGSCTAGAAYIPAMAEESVIVDKIGTIFLAGPPLLKAAVGEVVTAEELGGAQMHCSVSGCTDHFAADEDSALLTTRNIISCLNMTQRAPPTGVCSDPQFSVDDLSVLALYDTSQFPMYQILSRIVDESRFHDFKSKFGETLITGFAHIYGYLVGLVASNGPMTSEAMLKGTHFVELCGQRNIPLVFCQNTVPQSTSELTADQRVRLLKDQAKLMTAVACVQVPKITVVMGGSYGPDNYALCGRSFDPRFLYTWPTARIAMDTPENLTAASLRQFSVDEAKVLRRSLAAANMEFGTAFYYEHKISQEATNDEEGSSELDQDETKRKLMKKFEKQSTAYYGTGRLWDDGIVLPRDTRKVLGRSLRATFASPQNTSSEMTKFGVFRM